MSSSPPQEIRLAEVSEPDLAEIGALAAEIWPEAYRDLISPEQISYMLEMMYSPEALTRDLIEKEIQFRRIHEGEICHGFAAFGPLTANEPTELHKFYLRLGARGRGIAGEAIELMVSELAAKRVPELRLRVNRGNHRAIRFYEKSGFHIVAENCLDIGSGFVMDDFIMSRPTN